MQSPLKGLERLTEELRIERVKCTEALRDVARYRVENGSLEEAKEDLEAELQICKQQSVEDRDEIERLSNAVQNLSNDYEALQEESAVKDAEFQAIHDERNKLMAENDALLDALREREGQLTASNIRCQSLESRATARDEVLNKQKAELNSMRSSRDTAMQELLDANETLRKQMEWNEELKLELGKLETMSEGYEQTRSSNDELREQLDAANHASATYMDQLRELKAKLKERSATETSLEQALRSLAAEKEQLAKECRDLEASRALMSEQVEAEIAACAAAKKHAEAVATGRDFMDRTMHEMQDKHDDLLRQIGTRDKQLSEAQAALSELQGALSTTRERLAQAEAGAEQAGNMQAMMTEMDALRAQLTELRREKLRRSIEEDAGVIAPKAVIDRVEENKQFFEGIIQQLRVDLEAANTLAREFEHRYHQEQRKAHRLQSLEDEVVMYRDIAQRTSQESQDAALSISEEKNRAIKAVQEKSALQHRLHRAQVDLEGAQAELVRANEEVAAQREKVKAMHAAKIAADKRVAEASTAHSTTETALEELKQKYDTMSLELDKARRSLQDHSFRLHELQLKSDEVDAARADTAQLSSKIVLLKTDAASRERELTLQVESLKHQKATLERELLATREKVGTHRSAYEFASSDVARLRAEYDAVVAERDRLKRTITENVNQLAEQRLFELKRDVEESAREFNNFDQERTAKDKVIQQITAECSKEREKVTILKMQLATLEDKLRVANQELSVFRGIDVYHSSMQAQLHSYRRDRSFNDFALDVSAIRGDNRADRTDRDLGSAFANSINLASVQRPPSRSSHAASYADDSEGDEEEGRYEAPSHRGSRSPTPNAEFSRVVSHTSSPPILRPAAASVTAPTRSASAGLEGVMSQTQAQAQPVRSPSADRRARLQLDELETRSVVSEAGSLREEAVVGRASVYERSYAAAEETKSEQRRETAVYDSNIFSFTRPLPRSPSATSSGPGRNESIIVDDTRAPPSATATHSATGDLEAERREMLRRRAERKALRDQQLRERILREGTLNHSFSASRGADIRDDLSQSSAGSSVSGVRDQAQYTHRSLRTIPASSLDTPHMAAQQVSRRHTTASAASGARTQRASSPEVGISRITDLAQRAARNNAHLTTAAAAEAAAPAPYRPRVPDYARARSLLNM